MSAYTVYADQLPGLLARWNGKYAVYAPKDIGEGIYDFRPWRQGDEIAWDYDLAYNSLKRFLIPPKEPLISYDLSRCTAEPIFEAPAQLLFGVHPYDLRAITQLDQLMESGAPDNYYLRRREQTMIMALEPLRVAEGSFWGSVGAERVDVGFDLYWTKLGPSSFLVEVGTQRGEELLLDGGDLAQATPGEREAARRAKGRILSKARKGMAFDWREIPKLLGKAWDSPLWEQRSELCLACGSCNMVCPTCYCFDIREEVDDSLQGGVRYRVWDSCMLHSFAAVAGNHNFRRKALERYRHRTYRKGKYIFDRLGELGCVGCGRCVRACTAGIANPLRTFNDLWEAARNEG
ncbi:4Fe-4S dicluster domain-containing protein [Desulfocurvibacter africanus]|uniref:4Fe-4S dicluster domain-containing protein n=1 Tax=Desulfocurvibacter africanus TaxID=873 RepID=UPI000408156C|nr:4Fe-4S dicluster domain-containing protein [Desulfocurvibacter africanus]